MGDASVWIIDLDVESRHCTTQSLNYFVSKAAAPELSPPTLHLNKQALLLRGLMCSSPAVNLIQFDSLETITLRFHLIVTDKRLPWRLSVHLSSEIFPSISPSQCVGGFEPVWCLCSTPVQSRLHITSELFKSYLSHGLEQLLILVHDQHNKCWFNRKKKKNIRFFWNVLVFPEIDLYQIQTALIKGQWPGSFCCFSS